MIIRAASGWQTATADLALILFLITAQAVREEQPTPAVAVENEASAPAASSALALHRPAQGESVSKWLLTTVTDERQVATVTVSYTREQRARALAEGERLLEEAENAGVAARLVATPDARDDIVIAVDYLRESEDGTNLAR